MPKIEIPRWLCKGRPRQGNLESTELESGADGLDWLFYIIDYSDVGFQFMAYFFFQLPQYPIDIKNVVKFWKCFLWFLSQLCKHTAFF